MMLSFGTVATDGFLHAGQPVLEDADAIGFGGVLKVWKPGASRRGGLSPENGDGPAELVCQADVVGGVEWVGHLWYIRDFRAVSRPVVAPPGRARRRRRRGRWVGGFYATSRRTAGRARRRGGGRGGGVLPPPRRGCAARAVSFRVGRRWVTEQCW